MLRYIEKNCFTPLSQYVDYEFVSSSCDFVIIAFLILQKQQVNREEILLDVGQVTPYHQIQELIAKKEPYDRLWKNVVEFNQLYDIWMNGSLLDVNAEFVDEKVHVL